MNYGNLVNTLQDLERSWNGNSTQPVPSCASGHLVQPTDNVQYFACDNGTAGPKDLQLVVAIGINYSQGTGRIVNRSCAKHATKSPWVEDDLHTAPWNNRGALRFYFQGYAASPASRRAWAQNCWASHTGISVPIEWDFHLIETNFSPWITRFEWSNPTYHSEPIRADVLVNPPDFTPPRPLLGHVDDLLTTLEKEEIIWVGHGFDATSQLFRIFTTKHSIKNWLITPNLSSRKRMPISRARLPVS
jgi:hypothetical protein